MSEEELIATYNQLDNLQSDLDNLYWDCNNRLNHARDNLDSGSFEHVAPHQLRAYIRQNAIQFANALDNKHYCDQERMFDVL